MNEKELIQRCRESDRDAQAELYQRTSEKIYRLLLRITRNPDDAFDLTQETYLRAFSKFNQFDGQSALSTWLYRIAVNQALRFRDRAKKNLKKLAALPANDHPKSEHEASATKLDVNEALASLAPNERAILILRYQEGLDYHAIAEIIGFAEGTVASRLNRAREGVRGLLQKSYGFREENDTPAHQNDDDDEAKRLAAPPQKGADPPELMAE